MTGSGKASKNRSASAAPGVPTSDISDSARFASDLKADQGSATKKRTSGTSPKRQFTSEEFQKRLQTLEKELRENPGKPLRTSLAEVGLASPLLLISPEPVRLKRLISHVAEKIGCNTPDALLTFTAAQLNSQTGLSSLKSALQTESLFARNQFAVIWGAEKLKASFEQTLASLFESPSQSLLTAFVIELPAKQENPFSELAGIGCLVRIPQFETESLKRWVAKEVQRIGISSGIEMAAVEILARAYESDLGTLLNELEKLSLLAGKGNLIEVRHLQGISLPLQERHSNDLVKAILRRDRLLAFDALSSLLESGQHPLQISAQLSKAFRGLLAQTGHEFPLHKDVNVPWLTRQLGPVPRNHQEEFVRALNILKHLDLALKDSGLEPEENLALALLHLCRSGEQNRGHEQRIA